MDFDKNYFELLDLPVQFEIDEAALVRRYRELQKDIHPDRFADRSSREQRLAMQFSSFVNEAFEGLKSPLLRAEYLLKLAGFETNTQSETTNDGAFLMQQMELRESLSDVKNATDPEAALDALGEHVQSSLADLHDSFEQAYQAGDFTACKNTVAKMHFVTKLGHEVEQLEAQLLDY